MPTISLNQPSPERIEAVRMQLLHHRLERLAAEKGDQRIEITSSASMSTQPVLSPVPGPGSETQPRIQPRPQSA